MFERNYRPPCSIPMPQKALDRQLQQLRQWPPMRSPHLWLHSFPEDQTKPVDPYGQAQAVRCKVARLDRHRPSPSLWSSRSTPWHCPCDEASQSDVTELPALLRGKKILVVGDDRQVSPTAPFVTQEKINQLRHHFLSDMP